MKIHPSDAGAAVFADIFECPACSRVTPLLCRHHHDAVETVADKPIPFEPTGVRSTFGGAR